MPFKHFLPPLNSAFCFLTALLFLPLSSWATTAPSPRERIPFNENWRFQKGDPSDVGDADAFNYFKNPAVKNAILSSAGAGGLGDEQKKLGQGISYTLGSFDDKGWRKLNLPHDWAIEGPFQQELPGPTGKLPWVGSAWYRKTFDIPASDAGRSICLELDGAMAYSMVWCNGQFVGGWPYGYSSYRLDLTKYIQPGKQNTLAIRLSNFDSSSRWYPGAGIYRNVWLVKSNPVHVAYSGTYITTPKVSDAEADVSVQVTLDNSSKADAKVKVKTVGYLENSDAPAFSAESPETLIAAGKQASVTSNATVKSPKLWSTTSPSLYRAVTTVTQGGKVVDTYETKFGIRSIEFSAENGFLLNGKRVQLQGVCNHHDLGALGSAFNLRAAERQLEIMKEMGVNALRTAHNMPAPELLDLCDRMGILVMDESFDCWKTGKSPNDYSKLWEDWREKDLRAEILRDRNHPSVIMWSLGNELLEISNPKVANPIAAELTAIARDADPTRPTTLGSSRGFPGVQNEVGVMGLNYESGGYAQFKKTNPTIPLVGSETSSCVSSRGEYFYQTPEMVAAIAEEKAQKALQSGKPAPAVPPFTPVSENPNDGKSDFQISSYDLYAPSWAMIPDAEFKSLDANPYVAGEFVWTGFDYMGEPAPYNNDATTLLNFQDSAGKAEMERQLKELGKIKVPSRSSYFGTVDLAGFKKDRFYLYQARWKPDLPMAHLLPHWNWPERVGLPTPVYVYTSGDEAELFLNGTSLGRKKKGPNEYRLRWNDVVYQPGELKVIAYKNGKEWAQDVVKTTGPATQILLKADRSQIAADGADLSFITATIADANGLLVPRSKNPVGFSISGPGEIVATDNGDATSFEPFQSSKRKAYNGLCLAIVRAKKGEPGAITVEAKSEGLTKATVKIEGR